MNFGSVKEGFLTKRGGSGKKWQKRWFVMQDSLIYYFSDNKTKNQKKDQESLGQIKLSEIRRVIDAEGYDKKKNVLSIETIDRTWYIFADTPEEMREWIQAITYMKNLHQLRDVFKDSKWGVIADYRDKLVNEAKAAVAQVIKLSAIAKGISNKSTDKELQSQIAKDNAILGAVAIQMVGEAVELVCVPYDLNRQMQLFITCGYLGGFAASIARHGAGTPNEAAVAHNAKIVGTECQKIVDLVIPSPRIELEGAYKGLQAAEHRFVDSVDKTPDLYKQLIFSGKQFMDSMITISGSMLEDVHKSKMVTKANEIPSLVKTLTEALQNTNYFTADQATSELATRRQSLLDCIIAMQEIINEGANERFVLAQDFRVPTFAEVNNSPTALQSQYQNDKGAYIDQMRENFELKQKEIQVFMQNVSNTVQ